MSTTLSATWKLCLGKKLADSLAGVDQEQVVPQLDLQITLLEENPMWSLEHKAQNPTHFGRKFVEKRRNITNEKFFEALEVEFILEVLVGSLVALSAEGDLLLEDQLFE